MTVAEAEACLEGLYAGAEPYRLSHGFRNQQKLTDVSFTYGEVQPASFHAVLSAVPKAPGGTFYDLGSGSGRAVILSSLLFDFERAVGVELVAPLVDFSNEVLAKLKTQATTRCVIDFYTGDLLQADFSEAQVVFAHSACYSMDLMKALVARAEALMKPGAVLVTINKNVHSRAFQRLNSVLCEMDWGSSLASIYLRR